MFGSGFRLLRLTPDHQFKPFDCEDDDLNEFLLKDSVPYLKQLLAVTFVIEDEKNTVAFYSLLNDKITLEDIGGKAKMDEKIRNEMPDGKKLRSYPAMKIGRLGISAAYKRKGYGTVVLDYLKQLFITDNRTGCRFITVDAYANQKSLNFYEKNKFEYLTTTDQKGETRLMYFDLSALTDYEDLDSEE